MEAFMYTPPHNVLETIKRMSDIQHFRVWLVITNIKRLEEALKDLYWYF